MPRVLIVSPHFPPINAPDMQRVRMTLPFYQNNGWTPIVLSVDPKYIEAVSERELLETIPSDIQVVKTGAFHQKWMRRLGVGNIGLRALFHLYIAGSRIIRQQKIDLVFFSTTQFVVFILGRFWFSQLGVPYVIDLQDPWRTDYYERKGSRKPPGGWKYAFARFQAWVMEEPTFSKMSGLMSVSEDYLRELGNRYPWLANVPCDTIRFGASPLDFGAATKLPSVVESFFERSDGILNIVYTGAAGPIMPHALNVLFAGVKRFSDLHPESAARLRFHFIGTSYVASGKGKNSVMPVAEALGVGHLVREVPHRIGHFESLQLLLQADLILVLGSSDLAYSPSKLYPYYLSRRPMLSVVFKDSYLERILSELNCSILVPFSERQPKEPAYDLIDGALLDLIAGFPAGSLPVRNEKLFNAQFTVDVLAKRQTRLFDRALAGSKYCNSRYV